MNFMAIDPIKALFWSAVINGVVAVPVMVVVMIMANADANHGTIRDSARVVTLVMAATVVGMAATSL
jgi:Mn2+/Fe2+ NRAMP family transporter